MSTGVFAKQNIKNSVRKRGILIFSLVVIAIGVCMAILWGSSVKRMQYCLDHENYAKAIELYNNQSAAKKADDQVNLIFFNCITDTVSAWSAQELDSEQVISILQSFEQLQNEDISEEASNNLKYISVENEGSELYLNAEKLFASAEYLGAMDCVQQMDSGYSQYESAQELYDQCRDIILEQVSNPLTMEQYEESITLLTESIENFDEPKFFDRKVELESELAEIKAVNDIVKKAENLYNAGSYMDAFSALYAGMNQYSNNEFLITAWEDFHNLYIIYVAKQVSDTCAEKKYDDALADVNTAITVYDCDEFQQLLETIKKESSFLYRTKSSLLEKFTSLTEGWNEETFDVKAIGSDAGAYIMKSGKQLILGDYSGEDITVLSFGANILTSLSGIDILFDMRDISYDITHWGEEEYFMVFLAADVVALLPVVGVIKYFKYADKSADGVKTVDKVVDAVVDAGKSVDNNVVDISKEIIKAAKDSRNITDAVETAADNVKDAEKASGKIRGINGVIRHYKHVTTINEPLVGKKHLKTGIEFARKKLKYSDGSLIEGVFPCFDAKIELSLPKTYYKETFEKQTTYLNKQLKTLVENKKSIRKLFSEDELKDIKNGKLPNSYTWHHNEQEGLIQLVDSEIHNKTAHTGGMSLWGQGYGITSTAAAA